MTDPRIEELKTLVFDTETNGKRPKGKNNPLTSEPALVQIAAVLYWGKRPVSHLSFFMTPLNGQGDAAPIPDPSLSPTGVLEQRDYDFFERSGITQETVDACGTTSRVALGAFNNMVRIADRMVCHNMAFDDPIVRAAYSRIAAPQQMYWDTPKFCTMKTLEPVLKLPGKFGYKFPTLDESYRALVDPLGFDGAHDAMVDVEACAQVMFACEDAGHQLWQLPENWPKGDTE